MQKVTGWLDGLYRVEKTQTGNNIKEILCKTQTGNNIKEILCKTKSLCGQNNMALNDGKSKG